MQCGHADGSDSFDGLDYSLLEVVAGLQRETPSISSSSINPSLGALTIKAFVYAKKPKRPKRKKFNCSLIENLEACSKKTALSPEVVYFLSRQDFRAQLRHGTIIPQSELWNSGQGHLGQRNRALSDLLALPGLHFAPWKKSCVPFNFKVKRKTELWQGLQALASHRKPHRRSSLLADHADD